MIKLRDVILIQAAPERIFHWLCSLFSRRLAAMKDHMQEEGENLKKIIESGWEQAPA